MHKRGLSALLSVVMTLSILPALPASALESDEPFPYTLFAGSDEDGAITINADNVCLNGSVVTNGSIETAATNFNVNGQRIEHAQQPMVYAFGKLDDAYFDSDTVLTYESDYTVEDVNISLNTPIVSTGNISLNGNINLNTQLKAEEDILVSGGSCNANNAALISHHGDIYIESTNFGFAGLIYAPYGDIVIDSSSLNLNNVVVIGQTISIDAPNLNVNHNPSVANVIGTISEAPDGLHDGADNYFFAVGAYNAETSMIDIAWSGSDVPATVDVLISTDGETYSVVTSVTDATTYAYPVGNDFVSTYFKVSYIDANGDIVESIPFQAIVTEDGITIDYPDSDGDGIADILEAILGTDPSKIDTDDDGLTDYQELNITGTDPTDYDSVEKRISDADADCDDDGVSNLEEIELGTDPQVLDSDDDGLTDGEEVNTYLTDPLLEDTDGDGLTDGFEVRYCLDPLSPYTNGIADAEHKIEQTISADSPVLSEVNTSDSPYEMSVTITTNGDAERGLAVTESGYSVSLENDAQIGGITDLNLSDSCDPDSIRLTYAIKDAYRSNTLNKYSEFEDLQGIKRLCVFKYFDEISMMLPLDTQYDLENNTIYADVKDGGTYCVMDLEVWFDLFDLELDEIQIPVEVSEPQSNPPRQYLPRASADPVNKAPLDLVFILQTAGSVHMGNIYSDELSLMEEVSEFALTQYTDVRIYVIDYKYDSANIIKFGSRDYCTNVSALTNKIRNLEYTALNINDYCDTRIPFNLLKTELKLRKGVNSYIYHLHNGSNRFWTPTEDGISICNSDLGIFSQIVQVNTVYSSEEYKQALAAAIQENHGLNIEYDETTVSEIMNHIRNNIDLSKTRTEYDALIATSLTKITLDDKLSPNNDVDTDQDTIYDWDEADNRYITVDADGSVSLPTIQDLLSHINITDVFNIPETAGYARNAMINAIRNREVLPCKSDPTLKDSDGDKIDDCEDLIKMNRHNNGAVMHEFTQEMKENLDQYNQVKYIYYDYYLGGLPNPVEYYYDLYNVNTVYANQSIRAITLIQQCLEYLGLLDMYEDGEKVAYGTFGGKTIAAFQLFQINYGFEPINNKDKNVDYFSFQTLLNVAANNGFNFSSNATANSQEKYDTANLVTSDNQMHIEYRSTVNTHLPQLNDFQIQNSITISELNDKIYYADLYCYDYTVPLLEIVDTLTKESEFYKHAYADTLLLMGKFKGKVNHGKDWDVKVQKSWEKTIPNIKYYSQKFTFKLNEEYMNSENFGNFLYGCTGRAFGFPYWLLWTGSMIAGVTGGISDSEDDLEYVRKGFDYYGVTYQEEQTW